MILTADLHLTDNADDEYRWQVFERIDALMSTDPVLYILGDLTDRRDRHPSSLVNRMVDQLRYLTRQRGNGYGFVTILCGNHDQPLYTDTPFWSFLNSIQGISFVKEPQARGPLLLMPYAKNAAETWGGIDLNLYQAAFMHQSVTGATMSSSGRAYESRHAPIRFPPHLKLYSGDIHIPQTIGTLTYVGAPHHVRFGDDHLCRLLALDDNFDIVQEHALSPPSKRVVTIDTIDDLRNAPVKYGDKVIVRYRLPIGDVALRPQYEAAISQWASQHGITLAMVDASLDIVTDDTNVHEAAFTDEVEAMIAFAELEGIDAPLLDTGLALLHEWNLKGMSKMR